MLRKQILVAASFYFLLLFGLAIMVYRASPAPGSQDILGLGIITDHRVNSRNFALECLRARQVGRFFKIDSCLAGIPK